MKYKYLDNLVDEIKNKAGFSSRSIPEFNSVPGDESFAQLYSIFLNAIKYINKVCETNLISIDNLSVEIFKLILNSEQFDACFYLVSKDKYVFVFRESSGQLAFFGRHKTYDDQNMKVNRNFVQLFKLRCVLEDRMIRLRDNTGNEISSDEVIYQILNWLLSQ